MEEIKLFNELNFLKNEIEKDLTVLSTLQCDMMLKDINEKNRELSEKLRSSQNELEFKIDELKKEIFGLEKKLEKKEKILSEREEQIRRINDNLKLTIEENQRLNWNNCELKGENIKLNKKFESESTKKELEKKNRIFIKNYFENKYK